jgi:hypothetical protein
VKEIRGRLNRIHYRSYCYDWRGFGNRVEFDFITSNRIISPRSFLSHPDFNRRHLNFTDSTDASLCLIAQVLLANQMADASGRGL